MAKGEFEKFVAARIDEEKEKLYAEAAGEYLASQVDYGVSIEQFMEDMMAAGVWDHVKRYSMIEIANIINPPTPMRTGGGKRLTKAEKQRIMDEIPVFLEKNPWSKRKDIAEAVGIEPRKLTASLRELTGKKIKKHGQRGATVYAVRGEATKP